MAEQLTSAQMLEKSIQTTEMLATAGKLQPDQVKRLWTNVIKEDPELFGKVRSQGFNGPSWELNRIGIGRRVGLAHIEATDPQRRRSPSHDKITMDQGHITVPFEISERIFHGMSIEGENYENVVISLMANALQTELKQMAFWGNKLGHAVPPSSLDFSNLNDAAGVVKDNYFAVQDGWVKQLERTTDVITNPATVFDAANASISSQMFAQSFRELPQKYHKLSHSMKFMMSTSLDLLYREKIMSRVTALGDAAITGSNTGNAVAERMPLSVFDWQPIVTEHVTLTGTTAVALKHKYIDASKVTVTPSNLGDLIQVIPYVDTTDYVINSSAGTIARNGAGAITSGATVKVTYYAQPMMVLTDPKNLIVGYDLSEVRFLRGQNIYADTREYAMHLKVSFGVENPEACVLIRNIATT